MGNNIDELNYILVLPSWYPSKVDKFNGDFNERMVHALSPKVRQIIVFVVQNSAISNVETDIQYDGQCTIYRIYYPTKNNTPVLKTILSVWQYISLNRKTIKDIISKYGKPSLVHCYVVFKSLLIGRWVKHTYSIPLVLTEHWTAFYKSSPNSIYRYSLPLKKCLKYMMASVNHYMPVAQALAKELIKWQPRLTYTVIPNVVDTRVFNYINVQPPVDKFVFIHISSMKYQKNVEGILNVFEQLKLDGNYHELVLIGPVTPTLKKRIEQSEVLRYLVVCKGELPYHEVANMMKQCHCLVLFSRFENLPCVILEAQCCGLPVIATDVGGIAEVVNETNGILVPSENETALSEAMPRMIAGYNRYNRVAISVEAIQKFKYDTVSARIMQVYNKVLSEK